MKTGFLMMVTAVLSLSPALYGQAAPTAEATVGSGTSLTPSLGKSISDGEIHYSVSAGETISHGFFSNQGTYSSTNLSGAVGFSSRSERRPFSMMISSGLLLTSQSGSTVQTYQNASVSQTFITHRWVFGLSDSVSYLPQSPTTGYSGVAGVGDVGTIQGPAQGPAGGILTESGRRVSNSLGGSVERMLTASTSVSGSAEWRILRCIDGAGLETDGITSDVSLNHRLSGRTTVSGSATYGIFTYGQYAALNPLGLSDVSIETRGLSLSFTRLMTHTISLFASGGPLAISSSNKILIPSTTTGAGSVGVSYFHKLTTVSLSYSRGFSGGSGVQQGAITDNVSGSVSRTYGRVWATSVMGSYTHSSGLVADQINQLLGVSHTYNSVFAGVQVSRSLTQHLSGYFSYTVNAQTGSTHAVTAVPNVFTGVGNAISFGVTWAPRSTTVGQLF
ncbi:MAG TPA: hypothetical protein VF214_06015 [Edaphobacter sp.]